MSGAYNMSDSIKKRATFLVLFTILFVISTTYNACSDVSFTNTSGPLKLGSVDTGVLINQDAVYTKDVLVTLNLNGGFATEMRISNNSSCADGVWEPYVATKSWRLTGTNTQAAVYVKYRQELDESDCVTDDIIHDDVPPITTYQNTQDIFSKSTEATVRFIISDNLSGVAGAGCSLGAGGVFVPCIEFAKFSGLTEGSKNLWVRAIDKAGNKEDAKDYRWVVDLTKPKVEINSMPSAIVNLTHAEFIFTAEDALSGLGMVECRLDQGDYKSCASLTTQNYTGLATGAHTFYVRATDKAGNISEVATYTWEVDLTAPSVQITKYPAQLSNNPVADFEFIGTDGASSINKFFCELSKDDIVQSALATCASPRSYSSLGEGKYLFSVIGEDAVGNRSAPATYSWTIDLTAPTIIFISTPNPFTKSPMAPFTVQASDVLSGIKKIQCQIDDGQNLIDCSNPYVFQNLTSGAHKAYFKAIDNAGNSSVVISHSWNIDLEKPIVKIDVASSVASIVASDLASISFTATDSGSGIEKTMCRLATETVFGDCTSPTSYSMLQSATHIFYVKAIDKVGNESEIATHEWKIDKEGPIIDITAPKNLFLGETAKVIFLITDGSGGGVNPAATVCYYNGVVTANCNMNTELLFPDQGLGTHTFKVVAKDILGNESTKEVSWTVDIKVMHMAQDYEVKSILSTDILFIVDNSGSMSSEHQNMAAKINGFLNEVQGLDYHVAVTTTDTKNLTDLGTDGRLYPLKGLSGVYHIDSSMPVVSAQKVLGDTFIATGTSGSGSERGIHAAYRSIQRRNSGQSDSETSRLKNFLREDANLAVVVITDEEESGNSVGDQPIELLNLKNQYWPNKNFSWSSIIVKPGDTNCYNIQTGGGVSSSAIYGYKYAELTALTNGLLGSVCENDYTSQLKGIGQKVIELLKNVTLQCEPLDVDVDGSPDIEVLYSASGNPTSFTQYAGAYTQSGLQLTFDDYLLKGSYQFKYTCLSP